MAQDVQVVQQISPYPPNTTNSSYTHCTHAPIIFIVLYPSCTHTHHTPRTCGCLLVSTAWSVYMAFLIPDNTLSLVFQNILHAGIQETPPPHTFMTCIMDYSHIVLVGANIPGRGPSSTDSTCITGRIFRKTPYWATFNLCFLSSCVSLTSSEALQSLGVCSLACSHARTLFPPPHIL